MDHTSRTETKPVYIAPKLEVFGDMVELTAGVSMSKKGVNNPGNGKGKFWWQWQG